MACPIPQGGHNYHIMHTHMPISCRRHLNGILISGKVEKLISGISPTITYSSAALREM